jgi:acetyl/propionyl-CoA carboxylase alpha subunit
MTRMPDEVFSHRASGRRRGSVAMGLTSLLIANRGEVAIRILRTAGEMGLRTVSVFSEDDVSSLQCRRADEARPLRGRGAAAYLDGEQILEIARAMRCEAIHPGYGFLSESASFAKRCAEEGIVFVGPRAEVLERCGDKAHARVLARAAGVPVLPGTDGPTSAEEARAFLGSLPTGSGMVVKAIAGGGGRGLRVVRSADEVEEAWTRCRSEATAAFGCGDLYVERLLPRARHVEVQVLGDFSGAVAHLGERECSLQRRYQKLVEVAPAPVLPGSVRERLWACAVRIAEEVRFDNVGTFEFLVDVEALDGATEPVFLEVNPRLQVEHTVTEEVYGVDLVRLQVELAAGRTLGELGVGRDEAPAARGCAVEVRVNLETLAADGTPRPAAGTLTAFETASGPGVRIDTCATLGYRPSPAFDSLLAKVIAYAPAGGFTEALARARRALGELHIEGIDTNVPFLERLLAHPEVEAGRLHTRFVEEHLEELLPPVEEGRAAEVATGDQADARPRAGARVDAVDPLAVLAYGKGEPSPTVAQATTQATPPAAREASAPSIAAPEGTETVAAPMQGTIVSVEVGEGDGVQPGQTLVVMESMKMHHVVAASTGGVVRCVVVEAGDTVWAGHPLLFVEEREVQAAQQATEEALDLDAIRADLAEVETRRAKGRDESRPEAVKRRREREQRTARENVDDLCDAGTFVEYGPLVIAAQRLRRSIEELVERTPHDGMVCGIGSVNGELFGDPAARCAVLAYDYTVLAGTQGRQNHRKTDRLLEIAERWRLPLVLFAEGGGGRPGDTVGVGGPGDTRTFTKFARLSALVPLVGITAGRCFAGNASLLGCCDVIIAAASSNIGMGGPAMIEGGGLGIFRPEEIGPMEVQVPNGVVDIAVADEAEAVAVAKRYLAYFQGSLTEWECADQRLLRRAVPENRLRVYDVRAVVETLVDGGSVLELRPRFGLGMVTALARIDGRPIGVVANNPSHLAGAIDSDGADKAARFLQVCDAFDLPVLYLCDTPGIMVGPEVEKTALVRHANRLFVVGANLSVPFFTVILRKSYGLGAIAMAGGSFKEPGFTVAWPTAEFGGMGLEGAVKLGYRNELAAIEDPEDRRREFERMVAEAYEHGKALNQASLFGVDDAIDPADTRRWLASALRSIRPAARVGGKKRPCIDAW